MNVLSADDDSLVQRAERGQGLAWSALIARYERRVLVALLAEGLRLDEARDVAQEAWARIWEQHQRGALPSLTLPGLVITQARFLARDLHRRRRARPESSAPEAEAPASTASAETTLISAQTLARVTDGLRQLPAAKQRVFQQANAEGVPHAEIARREGLSVQRVKQIIWEVRVQLRAALEEP